MDKLKLLPEWQELQAQAQGLGSCDINALFAQDRRRAENFSVEAAGLFLDYSKQRLPDPARELLVELAQARGLPQAIKAMFAGERINPSEDRAAWHVALRAPHEIAEKRGYPTQVHTVLNAVADFVTQLRSGQWRGYSGQAITDVVNIGIGGSDLGPRMVCRALAEPGASPRLHFVANVDPAELDDVLAPLQASTTLFVVTSKSFTTRETLANAHAARAWLLQAGADQADVARHFVAVSTNRDAVAEFGIDTAHMFAFWDWVGGRFSLWSAVGLPIAMALGMEKFRQLLDGAHSMDRHFETAPLQQNLPVMLAMVGIWNRNFLNLPNLVVVPYAQHLEYFPNWLQQLEMESNGKGVTTGGVPVEVSTAPAIWGSVGSNAQHAFFQMLHQGTDILPVDFILPLDGTGERRDQLVANCLAQAQALMQGQCGANPQRHFAGNRPSNMLLLPRLDARHLGALLAAYEHKVYVQGIIWGINSFDQWGVELGKTLANQIMSHTAGGQPGSYDASTRNLLGRVFDEKKPENR